MVMPHRNNAPPTLAQRPGDHHKPTVQPTRRYFSNFAVIASVIIKRQGSALEN
jgi:hypothetical protein